MSRHVGENGLNGTQWFKGCKPVIKKSISTLPTKLKTSASKMFVHVYYLNKRDDRFNVVVIPAYAPNKYFKKLPVTPLFLFYAILCWIRIWKQILK